LKEAKPGEDTVLVVFNRTNVEGPLELEPSWAPLQMNLAHCALCSSKHRQIAEPDGSAVTK
jgi:hypothetical protein